MFYNNYYDADQLNPNFLEFDILSSNDVKNLSVTAINTHITFDALGYPVRGGLHDTRLGPLRHNNEPCATCGNILMKCQGHFGHIELPLPVINPLFTATIVNILKISCLSCHRILIPDSKKYVLAVQLKLCNSGCILEASELDTYLEEYSYKQPEQVLTEMEEYFGKNNVEKICKSSEEYYKKYITQIFKKYDKKICFYCKNVVNKITIYRDKIMISKMEKIEKGKNICTTTMAAEYLRKLWINDKIILEAILPVLSKSKEQHPTDSCFVYRVLVTPSNTRPVQFVNNKSVEHPKNVVYKMILQECLLINSILRVMNDRTQIPHEVKDLVSSCRGSNLNDKLHLSWHNLQTIVNSILDANSLKYSSNDVSTMGKSGLKQLIERKGGIIRKNMMGKRVDYFARTVITPDPMLDIDEIGVPEEFAKKLTYPVPVTTLNVLDLRKIVTNGPNVYPGANIVECEGASTAWISATNKSSRLALAKTLLTPNISEKTPKVVHRHLVDGDMLLINRQPSLHKPSIMAHKAKVLKGEKTFRLHYANCKAYNADFDGDEMNAHFPQNELAKCEASELANVSKQYLVPKDGTPLSGLIQDHVIAGFRLTIRGKFFTKLQYNQFVYQALCFLQTDIVLLPPTIIKPRQLWTGKQIISTIIINLTPVDKKRINLHSKSKLGIKAWLPKLSGSVSTEMSEVEVIIQNGELLSGVLDKNHLGSTHFGLIHSFYELYGGKYSSRLLGAFSKLLTFYLQQDGFTLGVEDILVRKGANKKRTKISKNMNLIGLKATTNALHIPIDTNEAEISKLLETSYNKIDNFKAVIDRQYKIGLDEYTNQVNKICLPVGLLQPFPWNNLQLMVQSGAKGSTVNTMQISCLLGQIELEGKRPPLMISGRALPSYAPFDLSPEAGGFIKSRFMTGLKPQEFFFHCMAGREGLIDTAVKTSRSGYLQRCLVKHLEGLIVNYDLTVRDTNNSVIQFRYGEDGLDVTKSQLLKKEQFGFIVQNIDSVYDKEMIKLIENNTEKKAIKKRKKQIEENLKNETGKSDAFLEFCKNAQSTEIKYKVKNRKKMAGRKSNDTKMCDVWRELDEETKERYKQLGSKMPDPVVADFQPDVHFGSVTETTDNMITDYLKDVGQELPVKTSKFKDAVYLKSFLSLCHPGEPVGVLAAQSVGEPSTQMTLNTFHFAGRGDMNVTLGIPRLREILMVASKQIKTPSMEIPFFPNIKRLEKKAEKLKKSLTKITLGDVLEKIVVNEKMRLKDKLSMEYSIKLHMLPKYSYESNTDLTPESIMKYVEEMFPDKVEGMFKKHLQKNYATELLVEDAVNKKRKENDDHADDEENDEPKAKRKATDESDDDDSVKDEGDNDATEARMRDRQTDVQDYDEDEEEEDNNDDEIICIDNDDSGIEEAPVSVKKEENFAVKVTKPKDMGFSNINVKEMRFDSTDYLWAEIVVDVPLSYKRLNLSGLLSDLVRKCIIREVPGIKRAITYKKNETLILKTEGSYGIAELFKHRHLLDLNKLYSNDIQAIAETYGIEAANRVIVREVQDVFQVYGIVVDPRHLLLIADYMTFDGTYRALNRTGMDGCPSPCQQMSFESTLKYLKNATIRNLRDNIRSPSSSLIVGSEPKIGTGIVKLLHVL